MIAALAGVRRARATSSADGDPAAARALLGEEAWELVRPDRPRPQDTFAPGLSPAALDRILAVLEDLQR